MHLAMCLVVNLASVATKFVTFSTIFAKLQLSDGVHEAHLLPNLHHF